jgi:hypothetical protein
MSTIAAAVRTADRIDHGWTAWEAHYDISVR